MARADQDDANGQQGVISGLADELLGYQLRRVQTAVFHQISETLGEHDITPVQWSLLVLIAGRSGVSQSELAHQAGVERSTLGEFIDRFEARGWVERRDVPTDRRIHAIHLTAAGRTFLEGVLPQVEAFEREFTDGLSASELQTLKRLLRRVARPAVEPLQAVPRLADRAESMVVRVAGDSGDGMQLMGRQFAASTALAGSDLTTFQDFPAEIRAPAGTPFGVSAYQVNFGSRRITTSGDTPDVLVALNPAALKASLPLLHDGSLILLNTDPFTERNLAKAGYQQDPRESGELSRFQLIELAIGKRNLEAVEGFDLSHAEAGRCKNFWALGLLLWMFDRQLEPIERFIDAKFRDNDVLIAANRAALAAGHAYGETAEIASPPPRFEIGPADFPPGHYRGASGSEVLAFGLAAAAELADRTLMFCSYPITPASTLMHHLAKMGDLGVGVFQAEDEIAAACAAIGASYGGTIGVTSSSGPGIALKTEAIALAVSAELPLIIINSQRGGPATGLPTKTEQSDLFQAVFGRAADTPIPVLAPRSPSDGFEVAIEAVRVALRHMTPVMILTDGYLVNAAEPWALPDIAAYPPIETTEPTETSDPPESTAFQRDPDTGGRPWVIPGTPALMHRLSGLETDLNTGHISFDPQNHQRMTEMRVDKINSVARFIAAQEMTLGPPRGDLVVVGWGSTYGPIIQAVRRLRAAGHSVSHVHIRHLNPFPKGLDSLLGGFDQVLVAEMNMGQLATLLRARLGIDTAEVHNVTGQPFKVSDLIDAIERRLPALPVAREVNP